MDWLDSILHFNGEILILSEWSFIELGAQKAMGPPILSLIGVGDRGC